jgi:hypothetical protein
MLGFTTRGVPNNSADERHDSENDKCDSNSIIDGGYNLFRVDTAVRASETTDHNGCIQTNSPFDFAECIPRLPDRRIFLADIS